MLFTTLLDFIAISALVCAASEYHNYVDPWKLCWTCHSKFDLWIDITLMLTTMKRDYFYLSKPKSSSIFIEFKYWMLLVMSPNLSFHSFHVLISTLYLLQFFFKLIHQLIAKMDSKWCITILLTWRAKLWRKILHYKHDCQLSTYMTVCGCSNRSFLNWNRQELTWSKFPISTLVKALCNATLSAAALF